MFVVQKSENQNKTIRMPSGMIDQMEKIAEKNGVSFNQLVVQCCRYALNNLPSDNDKEDDGQGERK